ncbi:hypothetical protein TEA_027461 [Camellia sinensis var. sinensis]|uniref:Uncharacterized protein n=1 Tax=Camellia sinensis var. sinensis TaxID=542762 RepID=A0A4S4DSB7_CAMSN|nr:hypothetical protein TEA_027461 [Camellia sinensis var. sinensis]
MGLIQFSELDMTTILQVGDFIQVGDLQSAMALLVVQICYAFLVLVLFVAAVDRDQHSQFKKTKYVYAGGVSCTLEVQKALPILKKAYGDSMRKVLHIGPETCTVVSKLLREEDTEAWGVEPYELDGADSNCKSLVHKGVVRVADIKEH